MKIACISLGCPKNQVDLDVMVHILLSAGHETVADLAEADVILVNTCGFIESAKTEAIENILEACSYKQQNPDLKVIVTGCLAERYRSQIEEDPNGHAHTPTKPGTPRTNNRSLPASGNTNGPSSRPLFFLFQSGTYPSTNFRYCFSTSCKSFKGHFDRLSKNETVTVNPSFFFTLLQLPIICPPYKITG